MAFQFLTCAMLADGPLFAGLSVFLAAWTDERGLIASSLAYLQHVYRRSGGAGDRLSAFVAPEPLEPRREERVIEPAPTRGEPLDG